MIHIPGDKKNELKDALRRVPNDGRYAWAFEKDIPHTIIFKDGYLLKRYEKCLNYNC